MPVVKKDLSSGTMKPGHTCACRPYGTKPSRLEYSWLIAELWSLSLLVHCSKTMLCRAVAEGRSPSSMRLSWSLAISPAKILQGFDVCTSSANFRMSAKS